MPKITFLPSNRSIQSTPDQRLSDACREAGFSLPTPCGGRGVCGKCRVRVASGHIPPDERQQALLSGELLDQGWRCACIAHPTEDLTLDDPAASSRAVLADFLVRDPDGDCDGGGPVLAVDLGTTTVAAALCDPSTGEVLATSGRANPQATRGDDVISRIDYALRGIGELEELRQYALRTIEQLAEQTLAVANIATPLARIAVAGNPAMSHLLLGLSPSGLAVAPFDHAFTGPAARAADAAGWRGAGAPELLVVPNIAAHVGGDLTAGLLAHRVAELPGNTLFMDIGTNGEIALSSNGRLFACAAAAGPAFEGARISRGMAAAPGAVAAVTLNAEGNLENAVLGEGDPQGICGTGLLDAAAVLLRTGLMDETGRLLEQEEAEDLGLSGDLVSRVGRNAEGLFFRLEREVGTANGLALTQRDIRELQLAKGAMAAGARLLLARAGLTPADLDAVILAGGFGCRLNPASALRIGLLPRGIPPAVVQTVGNASLAGCRLYALSATEREHAAALSRNIEFVELSSQADFAAVFAAEMLF